MSDDARGASGAVSKSSWRSSHSSPASSSKLAGAGGSGRTGGAAGGSASGDIGAQSYSYTVHGPAIGAGTLHVCVRTSGAGGSGIGQRTVISRCTSRDASVGATFCSAAGSKYATAVVTPIGATRRSAARILTSDATPASRAAASATAQSDASSSIPTARTPRRAAATQNRPSPAPKSQRPPGNGAALSRTDSMTSGGVVYVSSPFSPLKGAMKPRFQSYANVRPIAAASRAARRAP